MADDAETRLWNARELADYLGLAYSTVEFWRNKGRGPRYFRVGKYVRYRKSDVDAWLEEQLAS